ncbi:hypothetical protein ACNKHL_25090 [Shigella flexneri]
MMITLRKLPLAVAVAAGVMLSGDGYDFHGYARSGIGWTGCGGEQPCSRLPVLKVNTVLQIN